MTGKQLKTRVAKLVARAEHAAEMWQVCDTSLAYESLTATRRRDARKYRRALQEIRALGGDWFAVARGIR